MDLRTCRAWHGAATAELARFRPVHAAHRHRVWREEAVAGLPRVGIETADIIMQDVLTRNICDRRALISQGGLTGSSDGRGASPIIFIPPTSWR